ncbi:MAG: DUF2934 domain-containing protein [Blastocatellia bacterium]|nr:DUF2934 domain-containing protein [Blastocatellia bacterium]
MAKRSKQSKETPALESSSPAPGMESSNGQSASDSAKPTAASKPTKKSAASAKSAGKSRRPAVKKSAPARKPRAKKTAGRAAETTVTDEDVRIRAYLISEWRTQNGIPGDSAHDWLEARRQLQAEAGI